MTHIHFPGKVPIILVDQRRISRKMINRHLPAKVPITLVEQRRLSRKMTQTTSREVPGNCY